ncbi:hypothetical protein B0J13DRAFT_521701 [Dactylonectria estremocensis]|uniref:Uncharacterized protein n=1 Tax=Dactylonectria estremocensis TaxID=1079267 RepID=A0A9P9F8U6_9HYPO|nr:hypothetical protein B0J13DRAFT_521701 [Dactylonectria estremocensis]
MCRHSHPDQPKVRQLKGKKNLEWRQPGRSKEGTFEPSLAMDPFSDATIGSQQPPLQHEYLASASPNPSQVGMRVHHTPGGPVPASRRNKVPGRIPCDIQLLFLTISPITTAGWTMACGQVSSSLDNPANYMGPHPLPHPLVSAGFHEVHEAQTRRDNETMRRASPHRRRGPSSFGTRHGTHAPEQPRHSDSLIYGDQRGGRSVGPEDCRIRQGVKGLQQVTLARCCCSVDLIASTAHGCPGSRETTAAKMAATKQPKTLAAGWPGSAFERSLAVQYRRNASRGPQSSLSTHTPSLTGLLTMPSAPSRAAAAIHGSLQPSNPLTPRSPPVLMQ